MSVAQRPQTPPGAPSLLRREGKRAAASAIASGRAMRMSPQGGCERGKVRDCELAHRAPARIRSNERIINKAGGGRA